MKSSRYDWRNGDQKSHGAAAIPSSCSLSVLVYGFGLLYGLDGVVIYSLLWLTVLRYMLGWASGYEVVLLNGMVIADAEFDIESRLQHHFRY